MPIWGVGFTSPDGEDYVASRADGLRGRMAQGIYDQDATGGMGQWRDLWGIPLAWANNLIDWVVYNNNPVTAEDRLREWEVLLRCVPRRFYSIAQRQRRCADTLSRQVWRNVPLGGLLQNLINAVAAVQFEACGNPAVIWVPPPPGPPPANVTLQLDAAMYTDELVSYLHDVTDIMDRYVPAYISYTLV